MAQAPNSLALAGGGEHSVVLPVQVPPPPLLSDQVPLPAPGAGSTFPDGESPEKRTLTLASVPVTELGAAAASATRTRKPLGWRATTEAALLGNVRVTTALTFAPTSVPLNEPVGPVGADGAVDLPVLQAASVSPAPMTNQSRIRAIGRSYSRKKKTGHVSDPTQPVSRFAPLEAWAIRATSRPGVH